MPNEADKRRAEQLHREGQWDAAKELYQRYLENNADDAEALHAFGVLLAQCQEYPAALEKVEAAIRLHPNQAAYHNSLGNIFRRLSEWSKATKAYQKAIKIHPHYPVAYNNLGVAFYSQKKWVSAQQSYEKAIALKKDYADAYTNLGILLTELGEDEKAILTLKKALEVNPLLFSALQQITDLYLRHDRFDDAFPLLSNAISHYPNATALHHRLGIIYFRKKEFDLALTTFQNVLMLDYKHEEVNQYLANTFLEMADHEKALHYYFCQLERNPFFETYYNIAVIQMMKDRLKEALIYFTKALEIEPNNLACYLNLGHLYLKRNQLSEAILSYQKADQLSPGNAEVRHILSALTQQNISAAAPKEYVSHLFDQYAAYYDKHLTEALKYDVPAQLFKKIQLEYPNLNEMQWTVLDLGCGSGLCGELFKPLSKKLIGVDLSENMLAMAKMKNCYDELLKMDVDEALQTYSGIDLILAGDVFTYLGDLSFVFAHAASALVSGGLFVFTVEKTFEKDFVLQKTIRYAHSKAYLNQLIDANHFEVVALDNVSLRQQREDVIEGYLVFLRRP